MLLAITSCKQDTLEGTPTNEAVKVYLPGAEKPNALIAAIDESPMRIDTVAGTVNFSVPVYLGGFYNKEPFTVDVSVDNSGIDALIQQNKLPANTVVPDAQSYVLEAKDTVMLSNNIMKGTIVPKIKISKLDQYSGKVLALGIKISNASKHEIGSSMNKVILYFDADELSDVAAPRRNLIDKAKWLPLQYSQGVTFKVNDDGSVLASGGGGGHAGIYQTAQVKANRNYKIDMGVAGSGANDTWFEVYVGTTAPVPGSDYNNGGTRIGLNTWNGCGKTPFDGLLSRISCAGSGNIVKFSSAGTVYLVIRGGGQNLGTTGIKITNIDFRRVD